LSWDRHPRQKGLNIREIPNSLAGPQPAPAFIWHLVIVDHNATQPIPHDFPQELTLEISVDIRYSVSHYERNLSKEDHQGFFFIFEEMLQ
jgi:hypothetical protein